MSYVVLARKYRSRNFKEMVGQGHVVQALTNALTSQRLHHAYLFTGTRGIGKTTVSRILAKALNCVGPDGQGNVTADPCGVCHACKDIDAGRFVDYTELDAASNRGVEEVQLLLEQAVYKPVVGRYKVFMIDEVHMLSNTAFNAMLKTLEEPPEYLKFVLATTDPQKVPVTVLSRCLQFNLRPMSPDTVFGHLQHVLQAEGIAAQEGALRTIAKAARGSMRDALSLTDQAIAFGAGKLETEGVRQMLGSADESQIHAILHAVAAGQGAAVFAAVQALRMSSRAATTALEELVDALQRIALIQFAGAAPQQDDAALIEIAQTMPPDEVQLLYSLCLHGRSELLLAPDEYAGLAMLLLRLLAFKLPEGTVAIRLPATASTEHAAPAGGAAEAQKKPEEKVAAAAAEAAAWRAPPPLPEPAPSPLAVPALKAVIQAVAEPTPAPGPGPSMREQTQEVAEPARDPHLDGNPSSVHDFAASHATIFDDVKNPYATPTAASLGDAWVQHVKTLVDAGQIAALVKAFAEQCEWHAGGPVWKLRCANASLAHGPSKERLQAAIVQNGWASGIEVEVGPTQDSPTQRSAAAAALLQRHAEQAFQADPDVQLWMREYGAKLVPGTLKARQGA